MAMRSDRWSEMGAENLGENNIGWARRMEEHNEQIPGTGAMMLLKAILNDYWADCPPHRNRDGWNREKVDMVMSKLYWSWVEWNNVCWPGEEE